MELLKKLIGSFWEEIHKDAPFLISPRRNLEKTALTRSVQTAGSKTSQSVFPCQQQLIPLNSQAELINHNSTSIVQREPAYTEHDHCQLC